jgi:cysteine-rich repeat protein
VSSQGVSEWKSFRHDGAAELCGDGAVDAGEQCDDGNTVAGDGCDALCQIEGGAGVCGDGTVDPGEQCDDGNTTPGDGCDALCQIEEDEFVCAPAPVDGCIPAATASLSISEKKPGNEKWKAKLAGFGGATAQSDLGNPLTGETRYDLCVYRDDALVGELSVARAGQTCGPKAKPCFKDKGGKGWLYKDPAAEASGPKKLTLTSGPEGKGKALWQAGNKTKKGQTALPTGTAAALAGATSATLQLTTSDAACFHTELGSVKKADDRSFKAKGKAALSPSER